MTYIGAIQRSPPPELSAPDKIPSGEQEEPEIEAVPSPVSTHTSGTVSSLAISEVWPTHMPNWLVQRQPIFPDSEGMKEKVRQGLAKPAYNVTDFYKDRGLFQHIARSSWFEQITLAVISVNAVWLAIDADQNTAEVPTDAPIPFQIVENAFCTFFLAEWLVRFAAFKRKKDALQDSWFAFDSLLVLLMVTETWILAVIIALCGGGAGLNGSTTLRLVRLMRLTRMARMARLLRALPELMILIKGMRAAFRSVFLTLCLLVMVIYVFAIGFTQTTADTPVGALHFSCVTQSMYTLLMRGTFLDNIGALVGDLGSDNMWAAGFFLVFVLLATLTIMNMLIGVLCEVVSVVATVEKEEMAVAFVKRKLADITSCIDKDSDKLISKAEFEMILNNPEATKALQEVDVDAVGLVDLADFIFEGNSESSDSEPAQLDFGRFMELVLQLRNTNTATVKDIVQLRRYVRQHSVHATSQLEIVSCRLARIEDKLRAAFPEVHSSCGRPSMHRARSGSSGCLSRASTRPTLPDTSHYGSKSRSPTPARRRSREEQPSAVMQSPGLKKASSCGALPSPSREAAGQAVLPTPDPPRRLSVVSRQSRTPIRPVEWEPAAKAGTEKARAQPADPSGLKSRAGELETELSRGLAELQKILAELDGRLERGTQCVASTLGAAATEARAPSLRRDPSSSSGGSLGSNVHGQQLSVPGMTVSPRVVADYGRPGGGVAAAGAGARARMELASNADMQARMTKLGEAVSIGLSQLQGCRSNEDLRAAAALSPSSPAPPPWPQAVPPPYPRRPEATLAWSARDI